MLGCKTQKLTLCSLQLQPVETRACDAGYPTCLTQFRSDEQMMHNAQDSDNRHGSLAI